MFDVWLNRNPIRRHASPLASASVAAPLRLPHTTLDNRQSQIMQANCPHFGHAHFRVSLAKLSKRKVRRNFG